MIEKHEPKCFFCSKPLTAEDLFLFTLHHVDQDRGNNTISNLEAAHRKCHKAFHRRQTMEITELLKDDRL
jgi:5-methylcytosine-specific restriction endonuclease McrA